MTDAALAVLVALHVLGAAAFVGGQLALAPATAAIRRALPGDAGRPVLRAVARAAQPLLWGGLLLAAASGALLVSRRALGWSGLPLAKAALALLAALGAVAHVASSRRRGPAWLTGGGAALALLAGLALVALGALLRAS